MPNANQYTRTISITPSSTAYSWNTPPSWIQITQGGSADEWLITVSANGGGSTRNATLTVTHDNGTTNDTITVSQAAGSGPVATATPVPAPTSTSIPATPIPATATPVPAPTATSVPGATATPVPAPTATSIPATPVPSSTAIPATPTPSYTLELNPSNDTIMLDDTQGAGVGMDYVTWNMASTGAISSTTTSPVLPTVKSGTKHSKVNVTVTYGGHANGNHYGTFNFTSNDAGSTTPQGLILNPAVTFQHPVDSSIELSINGNLSQFNTTINYDLLISPVNDTFMLDDSQGAGNGADSVNWTMASVGTIKSETQSPILPTVKVGSKHSKVNVTVSYGGHSGGNHYGTFNFTSNDAGSTTPQGLILNPGAIFQHPVDSSIEVAVNGNLSQYNTYVAYTLTTSPTSITLDDSFGAQTGTDTVTWYMQSIGSMSSTTTSYLPVNTFSDSKVTVSSITYDGHSNGNHYGTINFTSALAGSSSPQSFIMNPAATFKHPYDSSLGADVTGNITQYHISGGGGCHLAGTQITLANGQNKLIEDIVVGDVLLSLAIEGLPLAESPGFTFSVPEAEYSDEYKTATVTSVNKDTFITYHSINEDALKITHEHPVLVKTIEGTVTFKNVKDIVLGDKMLNESNEWINVTSINVTTVAEFDTWTLDVEDYDVYFANGYLVHNAAGTK